jgi:hypothetical protein
MNAIPFPSPFPTIAHIGAIFERTIAAPSGVIVLGRQAKALGYRPAIFALLTKLYMYGVSESLGNFLRLGLAGLRSRHAA